MSSDKGAPGSQGGAGQGSDRPAVVNIEQHERHSGLPVPLLSSCVIFKCDRARLVQHPSRPASSTAPVLSGALEAETQPGTMTVRTAQALGKSACKKQSDQPLAASKQIQ